VAARRTSREWSLQRQRVDELKKPYFVPFRSLCWSSSLQPVDVLDGNQKKRGRGGGRGVAVDGEPDALVIVACEEVIACQR